MADKKKGGGKKGTTVRKAAVAKSGVRSGRTRKPGSVKNRIESLSIAPVSSGVIGESFDQVVERTSKVRCATCGKGLLIERAFVEGPIRDGNDLAAQVRCAEHKTAAAYCYQLVAGKVIDVPQFSLESIPLVSTPEVVEGPVEPALAETILVIDDEAKAEVVSTEVEEEVQSEQMVLALDTGEMISISSAWTIGRDDYTDRLGRDSNVDDHLRMAFSTWKAVQRFFGVKRAYRLLLVIDCLRVIEQWEREALEHAFNAGPAPDFAAIDFAFAEGSD